MNSTILKVTVLAGSVALLVLAFTVSAGGEKVTICHATGSATNPYIEITVSMSGWLNGHSKHGDTLGPCPTSNEPSITFTWDNAPLDEADEPVLLSWSAINVDTCFAFHDPEDPYPINPWEGEVGTSGSGYYDGPGQAPSVMYVLWCTGPFGEAYAELQIPPVPPS